MIIIHPNNSPCLRSNSEPNQCLSANNAMILNSLCLHVTDAKEPWLSDKAAPLCNMQNVSWEHKQSWAAKNCSTKKYLNLPASHFHCIFVQWRDEETYRWHHGLISGSANHFPLCPLSVIFKYTFLIPADRNLTSSRSTLLVLIKSHLPIKLVKTIGFFLTAISPAERSPEHSDQRSQSLAESTDQVLVGIGPTDRHTHKPNVDRFFSILTAHFRHSARVHPPLDQNPTSYWSNAMDYRLV